MDKQDTPEYALHELKCLLDAHAKHFKALGVDGYLEDCLTDGHWGLNREEDEYDERGNFIPKADENAEHRIGTFEAGVKT